MNNTAMSKIHPNLDNTAPARPTVLAEIRARYTSADKMLAHLERTPLQRRLTEARRCLQVAKDPPETFGLTRRETAAVVPVLEAAVRLLR